MILKRSGVLPPEDGLWSVSALAVHLKVSRTTIMRLDLIVRADVMMRPPGLLAQAVAVQPVPVPPDISRGSHRQLRWAFGHVVARWPESKERLRKRIALF